MSPKRQFVPAHTKTRRLRTALIILAALIIFGVPVIRNSLRHGAAFVGSGLGRGTHAVGGFFGSIGTAIRTKSSLEKENVSLQAKNAELTTSLIDHDTLVHELDDLKASMGRTTGIRLLLASVLEKPPHSLYDTLQIDGGREAGFMVGQTVYANGDTPIGTIVEVSTRTALVRLYSTPGEKTEARLSPSNTDITLIGRGGGNYSATVPHEVATAAGMTVVSKDISPRVIAVFQKVTSDPRDPFQTFLLNSPVNVNDLSFVEVGQ
jgi:cell shape-determining protein MreC